MGKIAFNQIIIPGKRYKDGYRNTKIVYSFAMKDCKNCVNRDKCLGKTTDRGRRYSISILTEEHKEQAKFEQTEYFKERLKKERYKIEAKNAETKNVHGLNKAKSVGLSRMRVQSYVVHITTNIKRIIKKMEEISV